MSLAHGFGVPEGMRLVEWVYSHFLLSLLPLAGACVAAWAIRRRSAGDRLLVWRSVVIVLLVAFLGQLLPIQWQAWIVPQQLASPFIALGRVQLSALERLGPFSGDTRLITWLLAAYAAGVLAVSLPTVIASLRLRALARRARRLETPQWANRVAAAQCALGLTRRVTVLVSSRAVVPMTWGIVRPVILLPSRALRWPERYLHAVLLHEMHHIRQADALFTTIARLMCALHWFNPAMWWVASRLRRISELACDDRVLSAGVRRSDYAELLALAATGRSASVAAGATALGTEAGLRERLRAIVDTRRHVCLPTRRARSAAVGVTLLMSAAMSLVQVVPTRDVLTTLMGDQRWEARAYAVVRLAARADSVEVARAAARTDPSPRVRAWAQYALAQLPAPADLFAPSTRR